MPASIILIDSTLLCRFPAIAKPHLWHAPIYNGFSARRQEAPAFYTGYSHHCKYTRDCRKDIAAAGLLSTKDTIKRQLAHFHTTRHCFVIPMHSTNCNTGPLCQASKLPREDLDASWSTSHDQVWTHICKRGRSEASLTLWVMQENQREARQGLCQWVSRATDRSTSCECSICSASEKQGVGWCDTISQVDRATL